MRAGAHSATVLPYVGSAMSFTPRQQVRRARFLRRPDTPAEARLWSNLRGRRPQSFKFVRQAPIGPYVVDFLCREARLIIEVDGATHSEDREIAYDRRREAYLKSAGYGIVRVQNDDVYKHINDVLDMILMGLEGKL
jgi:very-short-patch-repair endonuclease